MNFTWFMSFLVIFIMKADKMEILGDIWKHSEECAVILENFAEASGSFIYCTLQNSRPVHICLNCAVQFKEVIGKHDKILEINKKQNSTCKEDLINQDRLEVIETGFSFVTNLWTKGQCKNCFDSNMTISNSTTEFFRLYSDTNRCLEDHYNPKNKSYDPGVCHLCFGVYYRMSDFYNKLKETSGNGNVCMDIVDSANVTQHLWSNVLHCGGTVMTFEIPLIVLSSVFCILPVIFYLYAWKFTIARPSVILTQNRLSQRFRQRWRSRTASSVTS